MDVSTLLTSPIVMIIGIGLVVFIGILAIIKRYKIAGPNEALILVGRKGKGGGDLSGQKVVTGAGAFVIPFVQTMYIMDLSARRINVPIRGAVSKAGVKLNVDGIAIVKVGGDEQSIRAAAQRFLTQQEEIDVFATEVLAGALRSIVGTLSVEEIIRDRASFASQVAEVTESALTGQGLVLDTFQIQDITDAEGSYLRDLGRPEQARVAQHASIAESNANREAQQAAIAAEAQVLQSQRELALQQAAVKAETDAARATADAAGPLAAAEKQQQVLAEQEKVAMAQAALTDRELDTTVRKPADANRYQMEQEAEARRTAAIKAAEAEKAATIAAAEAKARQDELTGEGEKLRRSALAEAEAIEGAKKGEAEKARREAIAEAVRAEGLAQAQATAAIGAAEADAMQKKADAYRAYGEAAVLETILRALPEIAKELAAPMSAIDNLTVVSTEGASAMSRTVTDNFTQLQTLLESTTGVNLANILKRFEGDVASQADTPAATETSPVVKGSLAGADAAKRVAYKPPAMPEGGESTDA